MPRSVDTLERSPTELQRMVRAYLPPSWCLVVVDITTSIIDIVQDRFQGSQVIVVDWSPDRTRFLYNALQSVYTTDMHVLRPVPAVRSVAPSLGKGTGVAERLSDHVQDCGYEEEIHDQVTGEAEQNEVEHSKEEMEDNGRGAAVERRPRDESTDTEDDDTSGDEESLEEDDDGDGQEPSGRTLHSDNTQRSRGGSIEASDNDYLPSRLSGPR